MLLYADVPAGNLLCGDMTSRRRKRDTSSSQSAYDVPQELLVQVMNGTEAGETVMMVRTAVKSLSNFAALRKFKCKKTFEESYIQVLDHAIFHRF